MTAAFELGILRNYSGRYSLVIGLWEVKGFSPKSSACGSAQSSEVGQHRAKLTSFITRPIEQLIKKLVFHP
jgi:hypothetical protein